MTLIQSNPLSAGIDASRPSNFVQTIADFSVASWNTVASHEVFTVTGDVRVRILIRCNTTLDSATDSATIQFGLEGATSVLVANTLAVTINSPEWWQSATPSPVYDYSNVIDAVISNGQDIGYEILIEAMTAGNITFECWWEPLSAGASVIAGGGSAL